MPSPLLWGDEVIVRERLRDGIADLRLTPVTVAFKYPFSVPETIAFYRTYFGPVRQAFGALTEDKQAALRRDLEDLWAQHNRATDGTTYVEIEYLEVLATRT